MAVKTYYGDGYKDPSSVLAVNAIKAEATVKNIYSKFIFASGDSSTTTLFVGQVPSNARLLRSSTLKTWGVAGLTSFSLGFGKNGAVVNSKGAALMSAVDIASAASKDPLAALTAGDIGKFAWQLAGYSADPGGMLDIIGTTGADTSGAGTIEFEINYAK
ncbi:hypothetical protein IP86_02985 [Rhodopseudomonas sp. AAP120]|uniref:hypothetical protein n=1 Tax=Rhodopseudomonas sp. AAP120 TaxID=1523430 RepID=UPI0006B8A008|nr:hypothetical protein [Rhodopseudomonas sp. AAP120]KPG01789.1 hypothetical protein IP86_02985 [Rhodopseudomonas sp. AAP120]